jgi:hypothetical protein
MKGISATLTPFNRLPPRAEYIEKVMGCLIKHDRLSCAELMRLTGLTKTQVMCTLELKISDGTVDREVISNKNFYQII